MKIVLINILFHTSKMNSEKVKTVTEAVDPAVFIKHYQESEAQEDILGSGEQSTENKSWFN